MKMPTSQEIWLFTLDHPGMNKTVLDLMSVHLKPENCDAALQFNKQTVSYAELAEMTERRVNALCSHGIKRGDHVGLKLSRSLDLVITLLALVHLGATVVPLDYAYPADRIYYMLSKANCKWLLVEDETDVSDNSEGIFQIISLSKIKEIENFDGLRAVPIPILPSDLIYILFTSGSTGNPKGVAMSHGAILNIIEWQISASQLDPVPKTLQFSPISFDVSFQEILSTICGGGCLVLVSEEDRRDPERLADYLIEKAIARIFIPFVYLQFLLEALAKRKMQHLKEIITAGEQLIITPAIRKFFDENPECTLTNQYGPTETHVVTSYTLRGLPSAWPELPPIGRPVASSQIHILDEKEQLCMTDMPGEIYISGDILANGYIGEPILTQKRFFISSILKRKVYRTGDLAKLNSSGDIEYLGRIDRQVKILGNRVEIGEIEAVLAGHPWVDICNVIIRRKDDQQIVLDAYYILNSIALDIDAQQIEERFIAFLKAKLPPYMVPKTYTRVQKFAFLPSGKLDRSCLPKPDVKRSLLLEKYVSPQNEIEKIISDEVAQSLELECIGVNDNFFLLGLTSLQVVQLASCLSKILGKKIEPISFFERPTVLQLSLSVKENTLRQIEEPDVTTRKIPQSLADRRRKSRLTDE
jgi:amino acid adenylation domain-containing protein